MKKIKWNKRLHPVWGEKGAEKEVRIATRNVYWPSYQWKSGKFSIIFPRPELKEGGPRYELYDGKDTYVFDTFKEAKEKANKLNTLNYGRTS